jgi:hypothetical protein
VVDDVSWEDFSRISKFGFWAFLSLYPTVVSLSLGCLATIHLVAPFLSLFTSSRIRHKCSSNKSKNNIVLSPNPARAFQLQTSSPSSRIRVAQPRHPLSLIQVLQSSTFHPHIPTSSYLFMVKSSSQLEKLSKHTSHRSVMHCRSVSIRETTWQDSSHLRLSHAQS